MNDRSAKVKIGFAATASRLYELELNVRFLRLISGYAASAILREAIIPAVF